MKSTKKKPATRPARRRRALTGWRRVFKVHPAVSAARRLIRQRLENLEDLSLESMFLIAACLAR
jgi:hypothetical protein